MADRNLLEGILPFLAVAEAASFSRAADHLGVTPTAVSKAIRQLEVRQGTLLFQRTTRSVVLTEAGAALFRELRPAVEQITGALSVLDTYRERPAGTLRLTLSRSSMRVWLEPLIAEYRRVCPDVVLDLSLDDGAVDLASGRFDAGIRQGESIEKDMVAVRLTPEMRWAVAGSSAYFKRAGTPATPEDLLGHEGILYRFVTSGQIYRWEFAQDGREFTVEMKGHLIVNDRSAMISLAKRGLGLAYVSMYEAEAEFNSGELIPALESYISPSSGAFLYFPRRSQTQPKLRALIDVAKKLLVKS
jgi:DNA-binding transcriptional LysR family regulator